MLGKLLAAPVRLLNIPIRVVEKWSGLGEHPDDPLPSKPLASLAEAIEEAVDGEEPPR